MERAAYYKERGENAQALNNYIGALKAYVGYAKAKSEIISVSVAISTGQTQGEIILSETLFELFGLLQLISDFYKSDSIVTAYLESRLVQIYQRLDQYEKVFDKNNLQEYETIADYVRLIQSNVNKNKERLSTLKPIKEESDEVLKIIRKALSDISGTKVCPLNLEESGGCFIATAVYLDYFHTDLDTFREFRDNVLMKNSLGCLMVKVYYKVGPQVAQYVSSQLYLKKILRFFLENMASGIRSRKPSN